VRDLLLEAREHLKAVSERLGHPSFSITLDTYSHATPTLQQNASLKIANTIFRAKPRSSHTK
jgi:integrase